VDRFGNASSAYTFDGTDDVIYVDHDQCLEFGLGEFSVCCWVKLDDYPAEDCRVVGKMSGQNRADTYGDSFGYGITIETTGIVHGIIQENGTGEKVEWTIPLETDQWYFLAIVRGEGTLRLYVDGEIKDTNPSSNLADNRASLEIGASKTTIQDDRWFPGSMDDILIMNRAMTDEEITSKFDEGGWE
jgi:hypothetical protein